MFQGNDGPSTSSGYARGHGVILDNTYSTVASVQLGNRGISSDEHEFNLINNGETALLTSYPVMPYDLSAYNITTGLGWLVQGQFQEVNVSSGEVIFDWYSLDHVPLNNSYVLPNATDTSGDGLSAITGWDYFHINSVDKSSASLDYLISARHTSTIYLINSTDGSIIWRLSAGGVTDFTCTNFNFSYQHDARFIHENQTHTIISFWDNASNGFNQTSSYSSGKVVVLDLSGRTATLLSETSAPVPGGIRSTSQGNTQVLWNGGVFHGYGDIDAFSEHAPNGTAVLFGTFGSFPVMNYRAFTFNWTATPITDPALYSYARNTSAPTSIWVSWNGATEVRTWRFYGSDAVDGQFSLLGNASWAGFETAFTAPGYQAWVVAEALDGTGNSLRKSSALRTLVPSAALAMVCDDTSCPAATMYSAAKVGS